MEMKNRYKLFFGFEKEPFRSDIQADEILQTQQLIAAKSRFEYSTGLGAVYLITGEIGSGKSTTVRYLLTGLHPSEYRVIYVTATTGSMPLASRVVAKSHFTGEDREEMKIYILHHLNIAGMKTMLFDDAAVTAIHQGSGGIFRKANHLARGALIASAMEKQKLSMQNMSGLQHQKFFNKEAVMEQQPTMQDITDLIEQLIIKIILSALTRLKEEIRYLDKKDEIKF
jgi:type II secretory pathway predicted ATPase ExeA